TASSPHPFKRLGVVHRCPHWRSVFSSVFKEPRQGTSTNVVARHAGAETLCWCLGPTHRNGRARRVATLSSRGGTVNLPSKIFRSRRRPSPCEATGTAP